MTIAAYATGRTIEGLPRMNAAVGVVAFGIRDVAARPGFVGVGRRAVIGRMDHMEKRMEHSGRRPAARDEGMSDA